MLRSRTVGAALCTWVVLAPGGPGEASAQAPPPPHVPAVCLTEPIQEQQACAEKQALYSAWVTQMGMGVTMHTLPGPLRELLQDHYPGAPLGNWRFGNASKQEPDNATTDCELTYFNSFAFVNLLRQGSNLGMVEWYRWLAHELRHYEQCMDVGGRDDYAKMWWDQVELTTLNVLLTGNRFAAIHRLMPMEADADNRAAEVVDAIIDCCIHPETGEVVDPIQVGALTVSPPDPKSWDTVTVSVDVEGGAEPRFFDWDGTPTPIQQDRSVPGRFSFVPPNGGAWTVDLELSQGRDACASGIATMLPCHGDAVTFQVAPRVAQVVEVTVDDADLDFGESTTARFVVEDLGDGNNVTVRFSADDALVSVTVPPDAQVTGAGEWTGTGSFSVDVGGMVLPLAHDRHIPIRAWIGNDPSLGASETVTIPGLAIDGLDIVVGSPSRGDPMRREVYRVAVELSRAVRVPVIIQLESSDPKALEVPSTLTVEPGQTTATVELLPSDGLRDTREVTVRAFHAQPDFTPREATVTVRGGGT